MQKFNSIIINVVTQMCWDPFVVYWDAYTLVHYATVDVFFILVAQYPSDKCCSLLISSRLNIINVWEVVEEKKMVQFSVADGSPVAQSKNMIYIKECVVYDITNRKIRFELKHVLWNYFSQSKPFYKALSLGSFERLHQTEFIFFKIRFSITTCFFSRSKSH
ncbi:hypothetical protein BDC45DRAFT_245871 [Circinella umbellata]|nr:hypothetical protein BDC45DRAFT_245871 [Circinella umbellata]